MTSTRDEVQDPAAETREPDEQAPEGDKVEDSPSPPEQQPDSPESPAPEEPVAPEENATGGGTDPISRAGGTRKGVTVPDAASRAGRKRAAKKVEAKGKEPEKPKAGVKPKGDEKAAQKLKEARKELADLSAKFRERGSDSTMLRRARHLSKVLGKEPPVWARPQSNGKKETVRSPEELRDLLLGHEATALATKGKVVDGKLEKGKVPFGASCNSTQVHLMREQLGRREVPVFLKGVKMTDLKGYVTGDKRLTDLPEETRAALKELNKKFPPKLKMWARKDAAILFMLHEERKRGARRKPTAAATSSKESAPVPA